MGKKLPTLFMVISVVPTPIFSGCMDADMEAHPNTDTEGHSDTDTATHTEEYNETAGTDAHTEGHRDTGTATQTEDHNGTVGTDTLTEGHRDTGTGTHTEGLAEAGTDTHTERLADAGTDTDSSTGKSDFDKIDEFCRKNMDCLDGGVSDGDAGAAANCWDYFSATVGSQPADCELDCPADDSCDNWNRCVDKCENNF